MKETIDQIKNQITPYLTPENIMYFIVAVIVISLAMMFLKKVLKLLPVVLLLSAAYYYFIATDTQKLKVNNCISETMETKKIGNSCKTIFKK